jgi:hypothetical protein
MQIRTVPVSRRCATYEYLIPALAYIQSTMLPGALEVGLVNEEILDGYARVYALV